MKKILASITVFLCCATLFASVERDLWRYDFSKIAPQKIDKSADLSKGFVLEFSVPPDYKNGAEIVDFGGLKLRYASARSSYFKRGDSNPAIVAELNFKYKPRPKWKSMRLEVPINALGKDISARKIALVYDGVNFFFAVDGVIIDRNYPVGEVDAAAGGDFVFAPNLVSNLKFSTDVSKISRTKFTQKSGAGIQFYSPYGHNTYLGDVSVFYHDGIFHLLYLFDYNHHMNRWGGGAHVFYHMMSRDLVNWRELGAMVEITEPWQSVGTGTMFFDGGKYYSAFGWHTDRVVPDSETVSSKYRAGQFKANESFPVKRSDYSPLIPSGTAVAVSDDGVNFVWDGTYFNTAENPSIFRTGDGKLKMFCDSGTWELDGVYGKWRRTAWDFPKNGEKTPMRNTAECPSYFEYNGWRYLIMGVTGFWASKDGGDFEDFASKGFDIYDGLAVPFVSPYKDNRLIMGGWLGRGWASVLVLREIFQYPDGVLGVKWLSETRPEAEEIVAAATPKNPAKLDSSKSYWGRVKVVPNADSQKFALRFRDSSNPKKDAEFSVDFSTKRAQINKCAKDGFAEPLPVAREIMKQSKRGAGWFVDNKEHLHALTGNFAIENLRGIEKPFDVNFIVRKSKKMNSTILDFEIAGVRTLVSQRVGAKFDSVELVYPSGKVEIFAYPEEEVAGCAGE